MRNPGVTFLCVWLGLAMGNAAAGSVEKFVERTFFQGVAVFVCWAAVRLEARYRARL